MRIRIFERFLKNKIRKSDKNFRKSDIPQVLASIEFEGGLLNERGMGGGSVGRDLPVIMLLMLKLVWDGLQELIWNSGPVIIHL